MKKIVPHLWFDTEAVEATALYTSLFPDSAVTHVSQIKDTPSGDCDVVSFTLAGESFMAISAGPYFKMNPSISLFVVCDNEAEIEAVWNKLIDGGKALIPLDTYPWAQKYGWLQDRFGLSWQLSVSEHHQMAQKITPQLMFTKDKAGKAKDAIAAYTALFPNSSADMQVPYEKGEGDVEGYLKHARFTLNGQHFLAMDSSGPHEFTFNEGVSLIVQCDTQEEIDRYWAALSAVPESEECGWLKDQFGVSWQIVPTVMNDMMEKGTPEQKARVTQAFLKMKKFDIKTLEAAFAG
ncbi:MAG: VOC family protein [Candidatus Pacebacteria bacterium]|nr:VOC family protein [Candidatus Paceibacterota bacterium]